jgi:hypothetical protein
MYKIIKACRGLAGDASSNGLVSEGFYEEE